MIPHFTPNAAALLLVDYQVGTLQLAKTNAADGALRNAITLAKAALAYKMPIILTSSQEDRIQGRIDERLAHVIPEASDARIQRQGIVDAWKDPNFKKAVEKTGRLIEVEKSSHRAVNGNWLVLHQVHFTVLGDAGNDALDLAFLVRAGIAQHGFKASAVR